MYNNFICNYIKIERWKTERIKKENSKPEHPPFILDILPPNNTTWRVSNVNIYYYYYYCYCCCHVLVTRYGVCTANWIYWTPYNS
jgi:hypothetical protein